MLLGDAIAGVDEVGRGALAGDVVAAAVILDPANPIHGLRDSKLLKPAARERLCLLICERSLAWSIGSASPEEIDTLNILRATFLAVQRAVAGLCVRPDQVWIDGNQAPSLPMLVKSFVQGDRWIPAISAASILAKVTRDRSMCSLHELFSVYGFSSHKGYPTAQHFQALKQHGSTPFHRQSFKPVSRVCV